MALLRRLGTHILSTALPLDGMTPDEILDQARRL